MKSHPPMIALTVLASSFFPANLEAQTFAPSVAFSVHDEPPDGLGDTFNSTLSGLIRRQSTREDRAMQEYNVIPLAGALISTATLSGRIAVNNASDVGLRSFDFLVYAANGQADLSDFQIPGVVVGMGSYHPPMQTSFTYSFDVTAAMQAILDCGAASIGLKVVCTTDPNFPNVVDSSMSMLAVTVAGSQAMWMNLGSSLPGSYTPPFLGGVGALVSHGQVRLSACNAVPTEPGVLVLGLQNVGVPFLGGTLVPFPSFLLPFSADAQGRARLVIPLPGLTPSGASIFAQGWFLDPNGPAGFSATNAVTETLP